MDKLDTMQEPKPDDSASLTESDSSLPMMMERSGSIRRSKRRSTVITVQMISKKGQLGGQKVNTVQVAAESRVNQLEMDMQLGGERGSCSIGVGTGVDNGRSSSASQSSISDSSVPKKIKKISTSDPTLEERQKSGTYQELPSYQEGQYLTHHGRTAHSESHMDTLEGDSIEFSRLGATRPRQTSTPDSGFKTLPQSASVMTSSEDSFSSSSSSTQGLFTSASDTNLPIKYLHEVPSYDSVMLRKSYDTIMAQRPGYDTVVTRASAQNVQMRSKGVTTSASDSNIDITYHRRQRPHTFHQESHQVIEETQDVGAADYLFQKMFKRRTVSESEFDVADGRGADEQSEADSSSQRETWTSYPQVKMKPSNVHLCLSTIVRERTRS